VPDEVGVIIGYNISMKYGSRGSILVFVLVLLLISMVVAAAWAKFANLTYKTTIDQKSEERALQTAEAGLDFVAALLNSKTVTTYALNGATIAQPVDEGIFNLQMGGGGLSVSVVSTGWYGNQCRKVSGVVTGYFGILGGPKFNISGVGHQNIEGECPLRPEAAYIVGPLSFVDSFVCQGSTAVDGSDPQIGVGWNRLFDNGSAFPVAPLDCDQGEAGMICANSDTGVFYEAVAPLGSANYAVSMTQVDGSMTGSLWARIQNDGSMYLVEWSGSGGTLYRRDGSGGYTALTSFNETVADGSVVSLRVDDAEGGGTIIYVMVNGVEFSRYVDNTAGEITGTGSAGMGLGVVVPSWLGGQGNCNPNGRFDNYSVAEI